MADDRTWRLQATLARPGLVGRLVKRLRRGTDALCVRRGLLPPGVVLGRRGDTLFLYAPTRADVDAARSVVERELLTFGCGAQLLVSRWDESVGGWRQVDPSLVGAERAVDEARAAAAVRCETRTVTHTVTRLERAAVMAALREEAECRGVECAIAERPGRLRVKLTLTVSGPAFALDAFLAHARRLMDTTSHGGGGPGS